MPTEKPRRLGRGLEALLAARPSAAGQASSQAADREALQRIRIESIRPNPYQPRREFRAEELAELENSLRANGLLQPITVRPSPSGDEYELIAGERRLRAASRIGWTEIPALVKEIDDRALLTLALVENLQRADLSPIEEASAYQQLISDFTLTQQQLADAVGKDRTTVANVLRLLRLPELVRDQLHRGLITLGHARALLALADDQQIVELAKQIVAQNLSVREVEQRTRIGDGQRKRSRTSRADARSSRSGNVAAAAACRDATSQLRKRLQTDVTVTLTGPERGAIEIVFYSADDLDRLLDLILGSQRERM